MPSRHVGVEVSNSAVRIAEIAIGGSRPELVAFGQVSLPPRAIVDGAIQDPTAVRTAISRCLKEGGFSMTRVRLGVAGLRAITREIDMPNLPDTELDSAIRLQALDVIPFPIDKTLLSARPLGFFTDEHGIQRRRVLLAAAHRDLVDPLVQVCKDVGLTPLSIDLTSSALVRSLGRVPGPAAGPRAIVSIGAGLTTVVIHEDGVPNFVRTIATGGDAITGAIASSLDMPVADAEALKRNLDKPGTNVRGALAAASQTANALLMEIKSSIEYYATLPGRSEVQQVVVTGGGSRLAGFLDRLTEELHVPVVPGSCLANIDCSRLNLSPEDIERIDHLAAVVVGLTLPEPIPQTKPFNLIPPEMLVREKERRTDRIVLTVGALLLVLMIGGGVWRFLQVHSAQGSLNSLNNTITSLTAQKAVYDKGAQLHTQILADEAMVLPLISDEENWPSVLATLQSHTPKDLQILSFGGSTQLPADYAAATGPVNIQPATNPAALPTDNQLLGVVTLQVKGANYYSFKNWIDTYENKQTGLPNAGDFVIESLSGISATAKGGAITFTSALGVTGAIHTIRYNEFEVHA